MMYFIKSGQWIKVGVSANPWQRLTEFQTANPELLEMLAVGPGDYGFESELHRLFGEHRGVGEWFRDNERIRAVVDFMRATFPELQERPVSISAIDEGDSISDDHTTGGWVEFKWRVSADGARRYYPRRMAWQKEAGRWRKVYQGAADHLPIMTEDEYREYKRVGKLATDLPCGIHEIEV